MREDDFFSWAWPYFYYNILDDSHSYSIHPVQCNSNAFRLLNDTQICPIPIMRLLQPSLWIKIYNVGAHRSRDKCDTWTNNDIQYSLAHSCLHLSENGVIISPTVAKESFCWTNSGMFFPVLFCLLPSKKRFSTESAELIHPWSHVNTVHFHSSHVVFLLASRCSPPLTSSHLLHLYCCLVYFLFPGTTSVDQRCDDPPQPCIVGPTE